MNLTQYLAEYARLLADSEITPLITRLKERIAEVKTAADEFVSNGGG